MPHYRGAVERARQTLIGTGTPPRQARELAPVLAERWREQQDAQQRPFGWLGGRASETPGGES